MGMQGRGHHPLSVMRPMRAEAWWLRCQGLMRGLCLCPQHCRRRLSPALALTSTVAGARFCTFVAQPRASPNTRAAKSSGGPCSAPALFRHKSYATEQAFRFRTAQQHRHRRHGESRLCPPAAADYPMRTRATVCKMTAASRGCATPHFLCTEH